MSLTQRITLVFRHQLYFTALHFYFRRNVGKKQWLSVFSVPLMIFQISTVFHLHSLSTRLKSPCLLRHLYPLLQVTFWLAICFFTSNLSRLEVLLNSITWTQLQLPDWCFLIPSHHQNDFLSFFVKSWFHGRHCLCLFSTVSFTPLVQPSQLWPLDSIAGFLLFVVFCSSTVEQECAGFLGLYYVSLSRWKCRPEVLIEFH